MKTYYVTKFSIKHDGMIMVVVSVGATTKGRLELVLPNRPEGISLRIGHDIFEDIGSAEKNVRGRIAKKIANIRRKADKQIGRINEITPYVEDEG